MKLRFQLTEKAAPGEDPKWYEVDDIEYITIRLHACWLKCSDCGEFFPISETGMRRMKPNEGLFTTQARCIKHR
jgi:hypothetical protein